LAQVRKLPLEALRRPLTPPTRARLEQTLRRLLEWQRTLARWPAPSSAAAAPRATPIVSVYADGVRCGCAGSFEGAPRERLVRAFLYAQSDLRFGGIDARARARAVAELAYPLGLTRLPLAEAEELIAAGAHGLALGFAAGPPAILLPSVAREHELDAAGLLSALEHKANLARDQWPDALFAFETETLVVRLDSRREGARVGPLEAAVRWLAARVGRDGCVTFGLEPRRGAEDRTGQFWHGRAAVVAQALALHPAGHAAASRVRRWLEREILAALVDKRRTAFPEETPFVAGTLALAKLAGVACDEPLRALSRSPALASMPWHAAQVVCALGREAPDGLYRACVNALDDDALAPWTVMAARARGDHATFERAARLLARRVASRGPHVGGVGTSSLPEVALTAAVVEALTGVRDREAAAARLRALRFVGRQQHLPHVPPDVPDPALAFGAFPLTPVHGYLRADVTAHAALALAAR
jgi:hypothetical protein